MNNENIKKLSNVYNNLSKEETLEFELRFGIFSEKGFTPFLSQNQFTNFISFFETFNLKKEEIKYTQIIYNDGKRTTTFNCKKQSIQKIKKIVIDDKDIGCRMSISSEKKINEIREEGGVKLEKERNTFYLSDNFKVDLTKTKNKDTVYYEIELEGTFKIFNEDIEKEMIKHAIFLCKTINQTNCLVSIKEANVVKKEFKGLGVKFNNCKNIKRHDIVKKNMLFTEKIDGERNYFFINSIGEGYLLNNKYEVRKIGLNFGEEFVCSVFDSECLFEINKGLSIFIFDAMIIKGQKLECDLNQRISIINNIFKQGDDLIQVKKYFNDITSLKHLTEKVKENKGLDGIIFSTIDESYKKTCHMKWKPVQTIDLKFLNNKFYVYNSENNDMEFDCVLKENDLKFENHKVYEFCVDKKGELSFYRQRNDKTKGNFIDCAIDIIQDAKSNIESEELLVLFKNSQQTTQKPKKEEPKKEEPKKEEPKNEEPKKGKQFQSTFEYRKFHNYVKKGLYSKFLKENDRLLELACGKGGDLHKWNCSYVLAVDNNERFLQEAKERNENTGRNCDFEYLDINNQILLNEYPEYCIEKFDVCSIQFAIHYFFRSKQTFENLIRNINSGLKQGGYLIGTCMDEDFLNETSNEMFSIKNGKQTDSAFGNEVFINFNNGNASSSGILKGNNKEYIVKDLVNLMKQYNFDLVESVNFKSIYEKEYKNELSNLEKDFSFKNKTFVFVKK